MIDTKNNFGTEIKGILKSDLVQVSNILALPLRVNKVKGEIRKIWVSCLHLGFGRDHRRDFRIFLLRT